MNRYSIRLAIKNPGRENTIMTIEITAKDENAAMYRAMRLLNEVDFESVDVKEV